MTAVTASSASFSLSEMTGLPDGVGLHSYDQAGGLFDADNSLLWEATRTAGYTEAWNATPPARKNFQVTTNASAGAIASYLYKLEDTRLLRGTTVTFTALFKLTTTDPELIVGLHNNTTTPFTLMTDGVWCHKAASSATLLARYARNAATTSDYISSNGLDLVADRWQALSIKITMQNGPSGFNGIGKVHWHLNGVPMASVDVVSGATALLPYDEPLYLAFAIKGNANVIQVAGIDRSLVASPYELAS